MRLHLGRQQALIVQDFQTIALIVSQAFGSKKKGRSRPENVIKPTSKEELEAAFKSVLG